MRARVLLVSILVVAALPGGPARAQLPLVTLTPFVSLTQPLAMAVRAGDDRLYIAEKTGRVRLVDGDQVSTVLDLSGEVSQGGEQGLLGLAFAPGGAKLYVDFTDRAGDTHVTEFTMNGDVASSRRELLFIDQPFSNHNGGDVAFGPDGLLYISSGDGGSANDPHDNGQRLDTLLGKILRIDPAPSQDLPYTIPASNPFVGVPGARGEIWSWGLRNPWRFSFDRQSGDLWIGDVGQNQWEEIDFQARSSPGGENYGWNRFEGTHPYRGQAPAEHVLPIYEYPHAGVNCSVTGGYVYRGTRIPTLTGTYVYADFCAGRLQGLLQLAGIVVALDLGASASQPASFGEDAAGELYVLSLAGDVYRIDPIL